MQFSSFSTKDVCGFLTLLVDRLPAYARVKRDATIVKGLMDSRLIGWMMAKRSEDSTLRLAGMSGSDEMVLNGRPTPISSR